MRSLAGAFLRDDSGTTMIEYVIIASLIGGAIIAIVANIGSDMAGLFSGLQAAF